MAKSGIDFFPLDVNLDSKFELIEAEFGLTGFGVVVHLLMEIYGKEGYYIEWTNEVALLFAKKIGAGVGVVSEIVEASIRRGMFDKELYEKYHVLTSRGIQKRYFEAVSRRSELQVDFNILLVNVTQICKNVDIKQKNVNNFSKNADISKQSKVEYSRVEESKVNNSCSSYYAHTRAEESKNDLARVMKLYLDKIQTMPSSTAVDLLKQYTEELGADVVSYAINNALDANARNWKYIEAILRSYSRDGITTVEAAKQRDQEFREQKAERRGRSRDKTAEQIAENNAGATSEELERLRALRKRMAGGT